MIPARDSLIYFENLQPKQKRLDTYPDGFGLTPTYGINITEDNRNTLRYHLDQLLTFYKGVDFNYLLEKQEGSTKIAFNVPYEIDHGVRLSITHTESPEFITIEIDRY